MLLASLGAKRQPAPGVRAGEDHRGRGFRVAAIVAQREWLPPFVLALILGIWRLDVPALWLDERYTWSAATRSLDQLIATFGNSDVVFAPYYLFMHYWVALGGTAEWWLRLPSVVVVSCMAAVTAILGRRLGVNGLVAGLIVAALPITTRYAQEVRVYAATMLLAVVATLVLHWALERPQRIRWILYGVSVVFLGASHVVALSLLAAHAAYVALRHRRSLIAWGATCCVALVPISPLVLIGSTQKDLLVQIHQDGSLTPIGVLQLVLRFGAGPIFVALFVGAICLGVFLRRDLGSDAVVLPALWIALPLVVGLAVTPWVPVITFGRYFTFLIPAWALLAARAIEGLPKWTTLGVGAMLLALLVPAHWGLRQVDSHDEDDPRVFAEIITDHSRPGDGIVYGWNNSKARTGMDYYLPTETRPPDVLLAVPAAERGSFVDEECKDVGSCLEGTRRLWLITYEMRDWLEPEKAAVVTTEFRLVQTWSRPDGATLQLWERR
jgi:mannosyltransferase